MRSYIHICIVTLGKKKSFLLLDNLIFLLYNLKDLNKRSLISQHLL